MNSSEASQVRKEISMSESEKAPTTDSRNVYQRKLAVMAKCETLRMRGKHDHYGFSYHTVQDLSNHLRKILVEEGLDVEFDFAEVDGFVTVVLINASDPRPEEKIISRWPIVENDKGYAYTTKFPLIRMFLIGDSEEGDEAKLAEESGKATNRLRKNSTPLLDGGKGDSRPSPSPSSPSPLSLQRAKSREDLLNEARAIVIQKFGVDDPERVNLYLERVSEAKYDLGLDVLSHKDMRGLVYLLKSSIGLEDLTVRALES
jgi:hypothetical protein